MRARQHVLVSLCVSILSLSSACTDSVAPRQEVVHDGSLAPVVLSVTLTPAQATLSAGNHLAMKAKSTDPKGHPVTATISWSTSDSTIATVSPSGDVRARAPGRAVITARAKHGYAAAPVTVVDPPATAATVGISPQKADVVVGGSLQFSVMRDSSTANETTTSPVWSSSNPKVATVSSSGLVTGVSAGIASIRVTSAGQTAVATVTIVVPPPVAVAVASVVLDSSAVTLMVGDTTQIAATVRDSAGATLDGRTITWSSSSPAVVAVSATGLLRAIAAGSATVTAASEGHAAKAAVTVTTAPVPEEPVVVPAPVASVVLNSSTVTLMVGDTTQIAATVRDSAGATLDGRTITWSSSSPAVVAVSATGLLRAIAAGSATVTAASEGHIARAGVTVTTPPVPVSSGTGGSASWWSHQPSGLRTLTDQPWNSIDTNGWTSFDQYHNKLSVVADPTVPTGDPTVMQLYYPTGFVGGSGPALARYSMSEGEVYLGFYWKLSPNWQGHPSGINKLLYVFQQQGTDRQALVLVARGPVDGPYHLQLANEPDSQDWITQNVSNVTIRPGQWYKIEMHLKRSSSDGAPDGVVEWWVDGQLAARYTGAKLRAEPFSEVHVDGVWGGAGTVTKLHPDYERFGRFYVSGR